MGLFTLVAAERHVRAKRAILGWATLVAAMTCGACTRELHRRQGAVLVMGDAWGEIAPCG